MAPSRGLSLVYGRRVTSKILQCHPTRQFSASARQHDLSFTQTLSDPSKPIQSYVSKSNDPFLNLSIEHHILQKSHPDSTILFLYANRPCIVIGRNQNPWTEVNLSALDLRDAQKQAPISGRVDLVRRRSGGGTVFHDEGNLNWSITCPRNDFTRDRHAEMVVRALRGLGVDRARVNERHDIVLDQGNGKKESDPKDTHRTPYIVEDGTLPRPLKVSGSAYKLTRLRALHHATTLLNTPNLKAIPHYLRSPGKDFIQAKGVESVSSPVGNIGLDMSMFQKQLLQEFAEMHVARTNTFELVDDTYLNIPDIQKGYDELRTDDWMWSQTPQFDVDLSGTGDVGLHMNVQHGIIKSLDLNNVEFADELREDLQGVLVGQKLQHIRKWTSYLQSRLMVWDQQSEAIAQRLDHILPIPYVP